MGIEEQSARPYELFYGDDVPQIFGHAVGHQEINVSLGVGHALVARHLDQVAAVGAAAVGLYLYAPEAVSRVEDEIVALCGPRAGYAKP